MKHLADILGVAVDQLRKLAVEVDALPMPERADSRVRLLGLAAKLAPSCVPKANLTLGASRSLLDALGGSARPVTLPDDPDAVEEQETAPDGFVADWD